MNVVPFQTFSLKCADKVKSILSVLQYFALTQKCSTDSSTTDECFYAPNIQHFPMIVLFFFSAVSEQMDILSGLGSTLTLYGTLC
jgi:hypothetical protein